MTLDEFIRTDTIKTNEKTNEKPTEDVRYAIAKPYPSGWVYLAAVSVRSVTSTTDKTKAMTFQSKMEAGSVCRSLDDSWVIVRV